MSADAEDDDYLDDENADWKSATQELRESVGDTTATLARKPGEPGQKKLGKDCLYRRSSRLRIQVS